MRVPEPKQAGPCRWCGSGLHSDENCPKAMYDDDWLMEVKDLLDSMGEDDEKINAD